MEPKIEIKQEPIFQPLKFEEFGPFLGDQVGSLYNVFDNEIHHIVLSKGWSEAKNRFIHGTISRTARVLNSQIIHGQELPSISSGSKLLAILPSNIEKLRQLSPTFEPKRDVRAAFNDPEQLFELTEALAAILPGNETDSAPARAPLEDCADSLFEFLRNLAVKNGGLTIDQQAETSLRDLISIYNHYKYTVLLDGYFGTPDASARETPELPAVELHNAVFGRVDRVVAACKSPFARALGHTNLPD